MKVRMIVQSKEMVSSRWFKRIYQFGLVFFALNIIVGVYYVLGPFMQSTNSQFRNMISESKVLDKETLKKLAKEKDERKRIRAKAMQIETDMRKEWNDFLSSKIKQSPSENENNDNQIQPENGHNLQVRREGDNRVVLVDLALPEKKPKITSNVVIDQSLGSQDSHSLSNGKVPLKEIDVINNRLDIGHRKKKKRKRGKVASKKNHSHNEYLHLKDSPLNQLAKQRNLKDFSRDTHNETNKNSKGNKKLVLIYTQLHGHDEWYNLRKDNLSTVMDTFKCKRKSCEVTYNKARLKYADAVIFHDRDIPSPSELYEVSKNIRPHKQRWIWFTAETPKNTEHSLLPYDGLFNWTMTYKLSSDIVVPYLQSRQLSSQDPKPDPNINYAKGKKRKIAWLIGNCKFQLRMEVAHILEDHTDVYAAGRCRDAYKKKMNCTRWCNEKELFNYKFYLGMENGICKDYITEKYWYFMEKFNMVPIVLGGGDYSNPFASIPGSYINIMDFKSLKDVANYINYLDKNDTAYNEYFAWKQEYKVWHPVVGDWPFESYWMCILCEMLHDESLPNKVYHKLSDFWDQQTDCELPERAFVQKFFPKDYDWDHETEEEKERIEKAKIPVNFDEM